MANELNPIQWVAPYNISTNTTGTPVPIPCPSSYQYVDSDVSDADAGRTLDGTMHKKMIGALNKIELGWTNVPTSVVHAVLNAFDYEYFKVKYIDPKNGTSENGYFVERVFYAGDRTAPMYSSALGLWSGLSLNLIERAVH